MAPPGLLSLEGRETVHLPSCISALCMLYSSFCDTQNSTRSHFWSLFPKMTSPEGPGGECVPVLSRETSLAAARGSQEPSRAPRTWNPTRPRRCLVLPFPRVLTSHCLPSPVHHQTSRSERATARLPAACCPHMDAPSGSFLRPGSEVEGSAGLVLLEPLSDTVARAPLSFRC